MLLSSAHRWVMPALRAPLLASIIAQLEKADSRTPNLLRTLAYHRVDNPEARPGFDPALLSASPADFEQQMKFLAEHYHVVSIGTVLEACRGGPPLPPRAVLITFDDGYRDFAEQAWPILRSYGLPVTLFVATGYPDHPECSFWWDRLHNAFRSTQLRGEFETPFGRFMLRTAKQRIGAHRHVKRRLKMLPNEEAMNWVDRLCTALHAPPQDSGALSWEALRGLAREGVTLAAHTRTHPLLTQLEPARVVAEVTEAFSDLNEKIGPTLPVFAYPNGSFSDPVVRELEKLNVSLAFSTISGVDDLSRADPMRLRRINVGKNVTLPLFRARLLPLLWRSPMEIFRKAQTHS
jgi:peptidoglycan/xylan/chitin deacetylase (PgdA/CDA1 family)